MKKILAFGRRKILFTMNSSFEIFVNSTPLEVIPEDHTLLECLQRHSIAVTANCEGNGICGKCHVQLDPEHYSSDDLSPAEEDTLEKQVNATPTSRLLCQLHPSPYLAGARLELLHK